MDKYIEFQIRRGSDVLYSSFGRTDCRKKFNWYKENYRNGILIFEKLTIAENSGKTLKVELVDKVDLNELHAVYHENLLRIISGALDLYIEKYKASLKGG